MLRDMSKWDDVHIKEYKNNANLYDQEIKSIRKVKAPNGTEIVYQCAVNGQVVGKIVECSKSNTISIDIPEADKKPLHNPFPFKKSIDKGTWRDFQSKRGTISSRYLSTEDEVLKAFIKNEGRSPLDSFTFEVEEGRVWREEKSR